MALPAWESFNDQLHYGDARISTYDINGRHWLTEDTNGKARIVATTSDGQHTQVLTTNISGGNKHQLITLVQDGNNVDVVVNGVQLSTLVPDGHGGYKWGGN